MVGLAKPVRQGSGIDLSLLSRIILYCTVLYFTILYCTILYSTLLHSTLLYSTLLHYTILDYTIQYHITFYCNVQSALDVPRGPRSLQFRSLFKELLAVNIFFLL